MIEEIDLNKSPILNINVEYHNIFDSAIYKNYYFVATILVINKVLTEVKSTIPLVRTFETRLKHK